MSLPPIDASSEPSLQYSYGPNPVDVRPAIYPYATYIESVLAEDNPRTNFVLNRVVKYVLVASRWQHARLSITEMCETLTSLLNHEPSDEWYERNNLPAHRKHPVATEEDLLRICGPLVRKTNDGKHLDIGHPAVKGFFQFQNPRLPKTHELLPFDSPAWLMGQVVDEFSSVCSILEERGLLDIAEAMHRRVVICEENGCGPMHFSTLMRVNNLGCFLLNRGRLAEAEALLLRAKYGYEGLNVATTPTEVRDHMHNTYNTLGVLYRRKGLLSLAETYYAAALRGYEELHGQDSVEAVRTAKNLALLYVEMGPTRAADAAAMFERHAFGMEKLMGSEHDEAVRGMFDLALFYKHQARTADAAPLMERACDSWESLRGREDLFTLEAMYQLGLLRAELGELQVAEEVLQRVVCGRQRLIGDQDARTLHAKESLAIVQLSLYRLGNE